MIDLLFKIKFHSIKNLTIRKKLLISYFILIFLPLGILTAVSYQKVSKGYESQILYSSSQSFEQAYTFLSYKVNTLIKSSDIIYFNADVQEILSRDKEELIGDIIQQNITRLELENFLNSFKNIEDIYRASLFVPGWLMYSNQDIYFSNINTFSTTDIYKDLVSSKEKVFWPPPHKIKNNNSSLNPVPVISLLRKIRNRDQINEVIGVIQISILESTIQDIISKANITHDGIVYIQNSKGDVVSCSDKENFEHLDLKKSIRKQLERKDLSWETMSIKDNKFKVTARGIDNTDWTLITVIPFSEIFAQSNRIRDLMVALMLILGFISYGFANFISTSTVKRIITLMEKIKSVQDGNLDVKIVSNSQDEIGKLTDNFNYMVKRIRLLVKEQYENGKEIKNLELKALQSQINPHFLYNTLELINWKAMDNDVPEIAIITQSLAKYYKLSLNKGKDIVSIEDEINHIKVYVQIQNLRFDHRINLVIDIDQDIYSYDILKLLLQPIVENSIIHGILENWNRKEGCITISGHFDNDDITLTVRDDGVGMTEEKAEEILSMESTSKAHGYGIRNINHRIKLYFGQQYGLTYHSVPQQGTLVEIRIPAVRDKKRLSNFRAFNHHIS